MVNDSGTVQLYYTEAGSGLPVVLLHGFPFDHSIWQAQQAALSQSFRVIAPDLRGHGQSPLVEDEVYPMETLAGDVLALLDRLDIERAVWVGHSMGGYVTMAALRLAPERVQALGLVATHPHADSHEKRLQRQESADSAAQSGSTDTAHSMLAVLFASGVEGSSPLAQSVYDIMINTPGPTMAGAMRGMAQRPDSLDVLRAANLPTLVIAGAEDRVIEPAVVQNMEAQMPHARLVTIEGAGHLPMLENPEATTNALRDFLTTLSPR